MGEMMPNCLYAHIFSYMYTSSLQSRNWENLKEVKEAEKKTLEATSGFFKSIILLTARNHHTTRKTLVERTWTQFFIIAKSTSIFTFSRSIQNLLTNTLWKIRINRTLWTRIPKISHEWRRGRKENTQTVGHTRGYSTISLHYSSKSLKFKTQIWADTPPSYL